MRTQTIIFAIAVTTGTLSLPAMRVSAETAREPKWGLATNGDTGWCSPSIGPDGTVYIGDISGRLRAVNSDGTEKWSARIANNLSGSSPALAADGTRIYIGEMATPGRVFCVRAADGKVVWAHTLPHPTHLKRTPNRGQKLGGGINSTPSISHDGKTIYFGSGNWLECNPASEDFFDDRLFALDVSTDSPSLKWTLKGSVVDKVQNEERLSFWACPSIAPNGTIYIGSFNGFLYHIRDDSNDFKILHKFNFDPHKVKKAKDEGIPPEIWSSCAIGDDGTVYVASNDGQMWAFHSDLKVKWNVQFKYGGEFYEAFASPVLTPNGLVIIGNEKGYLLGLRQTDGSQVWRYPDTGRPREEWWRTPSVNADGLLIVGSEKSGRYFAVNSADGKLAWKTTEIGDETGAFPAIADDGTIYVTGGFKGGLFAFRGTSPLAKTPWAKGMNNNANNSRFAGQNAR